MPYSSKEKRNRHNRTPAARERIYARQQSPKGRAARRRYLVSEKGKAMYRRANLKKCYNISTENWDMLFYAQGSRCAACGSDEPGSRLGWHTDHDHETTKIRGILCHPCNMALGNAKEDVKRLAALIVYLEKHNA